MANGQPQSNPPGWTLLHTLKGHIIKINRMKWTPDGSKLVTPSDDGIIKIWDGATGEELHTLPVKKGYIFDVAITPDSRQIVTPAGNHVELWDIATGEKVRTFTGHHKRVMGVAITPDGKWIISGADDPSFKVWDFASGEVVETLTTSSLGYAQGMIALTPDGRFFITPVNSLRLIVSEFATRKDVRNFEGHTESLLSLTVTPDGRRVIAGGDDRRINVWEFETGALERTLEGHTQTVTGVAVSHDGRFLLSKGHGESVRLWRCQDWQLLSVLPESQGSTYVRSTPIFHPLRSDLVATYGEVTHDEVRIWQLDYDAILRHANLTSTVNYTTAKLALVGDSGVGKSGLGWRLAEGKFRETFSTHGQQFWAMKEWGTTRQDGTECEAVLWDFAGQSYYRLVHALFLDDVDLALLLFDPTDMKEPLEGVEYWLKQLPGDGRAVPMILVGARADRGVSNLSKDEIEAFCQDRGITGGYLAASAYTGEGVDALVGLIKGLIDWDGMTATVTTDTFKRTKDFVLKLKESQGLRVLVAREQLRERLQATDPAWEFTDGEMMTAIKHLETHGFVKVLRGSAESQAILLAPDLLINLASSIVLQAGRNQEDLGALDEAEVRRGGYEFPELAKLEPDERDALLDAATSLFLNRNLCFRETLGRSTYLVFPALIKQKRPNVEASAQTKEDAAYRITGAVENVYAALVVLLGYTNTFTRTNHWHHQAQYETEGYVCGFRQTEERAGEIELVLYYAADTPPHARQLFQALFEGFLTRRKVRVRRFPPLACADCGQVQERSVVMKRLAEQKRSMRCEECGEEIVLPQPDELLALPPKQQAVVNEEKALTERRTAFEAEMVYVKRLVDERGRQAPSCFISYAWGEAADERWVAQLAGDLKNQGVTVILDQWENMGIGANIARFVERVHGSDFVLVVGTPDYVRKRKNVRPDDPQHGFVVSAEADLFDQRLVSGNEETKATVLPALLKGGKETSLPPFLQGRVHADFRQEKLYFVSLFELVLTLYRLSNDAAVRDLRQKMREQANK